MCSLAVFELFQFFTFSIWQNLGTTPPPGQMAKSAPPPQKPHSNFFWTSVRIQNGKLILIITYPWTFVFFVLWHWASKVCGSQFPAYVNASILKMDILTGKLIRLCIMTYLVILDQIHLAAVTLTSKSFPMSIIGFFYCHPFQNGYNNTLTHLSLCNTWCCF